MQLITHQNHIDRLPQSPIKFHILARFDQLSEETDVPPCLVWVETFDDPRNIEFCFIGSNGLLSNLYNEYDPEEESFTSPFQGISRHPNLKIWEVLYLEFDMGTWLIIPDEVTESHPELLLALTAQELSDPQPL